MRWQRTLIIWLLLMAGFSLYNVLPIVSTLTISPSLSQDSKVLAYNFTMNKPNSVQDNFTTRIILENNPSFYNVRAFVYNWFNLQSISALGEYDLNYSVYINGVNAATGNEGVVWRHQSYGLSAQGPIPDLSVQENMTSVHTGVNIIEFRFIEFSKLSQYGSGYYYLKLGPFSVEVGARPVSMIGPLALETIAGVLLIPVSHAISAASYKFKRKSSSLPMTQAS